MTRALNKRDRLLKRVGRCFKKVVSERSKKKRKPVAAGTGGDNETIDEILDQVCREASIEAAQFSMALPYHNSAYPEPDRLSAKPKPVRRLVKPSKSPRFERSSIVTVRIEAVEDGFMTAKEYCASQDGFLVKSSYPIPVDGGTTYMYDLEGVNNDVPHEYLVLISDGTKPEQLGQTADIRKRRCLKL